MKKRNEKLTPEEAKRLEKFMDENGGQVKSMELLGVSPVTISRTVNRRTAPLPLFRKELIEKKIILPPKKKTNELTAR